MGMIIYNVHADFSSDFCCCPVSTKLREVERLEVRNSIKLDISVGVKHPRKTWPFKRNFAA